MSVSNWLKLDKYLITNFRITDDIMQNINATKRVTDSFYMYIAKNIYVSDFKKNVTKRTWNRYQQTQPLNVNCCYRLK